MDDRLELAQAVAAQVLNMLRAEARRKRQAAHGHADIRFAAQMVTEADGVDNACNAVAPMLEAITETMLNNLMEGRRVQ